MKEIGCSLSIVVDVSTDAQASVGQGETSNLLATPSLKDPIRLSVMHPQRHDHYCYTLCGALEVGAKDEGSNPFSPAISAIILDTSGLWSKGKDIGNSITRPLNQPTKVVGSRSPKPTGCHG